MANVIGATVKLGGESEFTRAVKTCNTELTKMKTALSATKTEFAGQQNTLKALEEKHKNLQDVLTAQIKKEEAVKKALDNSRKQYIDLDKAVKDANASLEKNIKDEEKKLQGMESAGKSSQEALEAQKKKIDDLKASQEANNKTLDAAKDRIANWEAKLATAESQTEKANKALVENEKYLGEAEKACDKCATSIDEFGKNASSSSQKIAAFTEKTAGMDALSAKAEIWNKAGDAIKSIVSNAYSSAKELDEGYDIIITKTGATGDALDELNDVADNIFGDLPTDMATVGVAVGEVNTRFGQTGDILEETSKQFIEFAEINGTDLNSSIDTVDRIIKQFGLDASDAGNILGIMTKRGQETGVIVTDLMNAIDSNSATLKELNLGVEESVNLMAMFESNGVDASTAMRALKTAVNNYAAEGLTAREGLDKTIESIKNATTNTEALAIAQETFGTKGAQVMADGIRTGRIDLDTLSDSLSNYGTIVSDTYNATLDPWDKMTVATNNLKTAGQQLMGEFFESVEPVVQGVTSAIKTATDAFKKVPDPVKKVLTAIVATGAAFAVLGPKIVSVRSALATLKMARSVTDMLSGAGTAAGSCAGMFKTLTSVLVSPAGLAIAIGTAAVALLSWIANINRSETATEKLKGEIKQLKEEASKAREELNTAMDAAADTAGEALAKASMATDAVNELKALSSQQASAAGISNKQQERMVQLVGELNSLYPDLGLAIDQTTGALNMSNEEMDRHITLLMENAKAQAYADASADAWKAVVAAETEAGKAHEVYKAAQDNLSDVINKKSSIMNQEIKRVDKLKEKQAELNKATINGADNIEELSLEVANLERGYYEVNGTTYDYTEALTVLDQEMDDAKDATRDAYNEYKATTDAVSDATKQAEEYTLAANNATDSVIENTNAMTGETEALNLTAATLEEVNTAIASGNVTRQEALESNAAYRDQMITSAQEIVDAVTAAESGMQGAISNTRDLFEKFTEDAPVSIETMIENLTGQTAAIEGWLDNIEYLANQDINEGLLQYLIDAGPSAAGSVQNIRDSIETAGTSEGSPFATLNSAWTQYDALHTDEAIGNVKNSVAAIAAGGQEALAEVAESFGLPAEDVGKNIGQGLVNGLDTMLDGIKTKSKEAGQESVGSVAEGAETASPSRATTRTGAYIAAGLMKGMDMYAPLVRERGMNLGRAAVNGINSTAKYDEGRMVGNQLAQGFADGIREGIPAVTGAVGSMANSAIITAKVTLDVHSPSKKFAKIGGYTADGFIEGIENKRAAVRDAINSLVGINPMIKSSRSNGSATGTSVNQNQTFNFYQPIESPSDVAKQIKRLGRKLAYA